MPNDGNISVPIYVWARVGFFFSFFITIISYFLKKALENSKENDDIIFERLREIEQKLNVLIGRNYENK